MTHPFLDEPENRAILRICNTAPGYIPLVVDGNLHAVREVALADYPVPENPSVADYVLGLMVLGFRWQRIGREEIEMIQPSVFRSPSWQVRAEQIQSTAANRTDDWRADIAAYLAESAV